MAPEVRGVPAVLGAVREVLRDGDVVHLEAPAGRAVRVGIAYGDEAVLPAARHGGGGGAYAVDLESVGLVERAVGAEGTRDEFGRLGLVGGEDVDFLGDKELRGGFGEGPEDGLAADDDEGRFAREVRNGADGVLEFLAGHRGSGVSARSRAVTSGGAAAGGVQSGGAPGGG